VEELERGIVPTGAIELGVNVMTLVACCLEVAVLEAETTCRGLETGVEGAGLWRSR